MDIRAARLLAACLAPLTLSAPAAAAPADPTDLPARFVSTWQDQYLHGQPRRVVTEETPGNGFFPTVTEDRYSPEGVLVSHVSATGRGKQSAAGSWRLRYEKGRVLEIAYAPASYGGGIRGGTARPLRYDGEGRVIAMAGDRSLLPAGVGQSADPAGAEGSDILTLIEYGGGRQVHDVHAGRTFVYQLTFEFGPDDRLLRSSCTRGRCEQAPLVEYGEFGPVFRQEGEVETRWDYLDGVVASEVSRFITTGAFTDQRYYEAYRFDACGNWIYREQYNASFAIATRQRTAIARRQLEYYQPCRPASP